MTARQEKCIVDLMKIIEWLRGKRDVLLCPGVFAAGMPEAALFNKKKRKLHEKGG